MVLLAVLAGATSARAAGGPPDTAACFDTNATSQQKIDACTEVLSVDAVTTAQGASALYDRGLAQYQLRHFDRAVADATTLLASLPKGSAADEVRRGRAFDLRGSAYAASGDDRRAIDDFTQAISLDPNDTRPLEQRAGVEARLGRFAAALADYGAALAADPDDMFALRGRAAVEQRAGDDAAALADYATALSIAPTDLATEMARGTLEREGGHCDRATADFSAAANNAPTMAAPHIGLAQCDVDRGRFDDALAEYATALRLNAHAVGALTGRGDVEHERGHDDLAVAAYRQALQLAPRDELAYRDLGRVAFDRGAFAEADADFARALALAPRDPYALLAQHIARLHEADHQPAAFQTAVDALDLPVWPAPILQLYVGKGTPQAVFDAAKSDEQRCEATFYVAEWHLARHDEDPRDGFARAVSICPHDFVERDYAQAELRRMAR